MSERPDISKDVFEEHIKRELISEFVETIRSWLNTGNKSSYWEAIKSEYEEKLQ